MWLIFQVDAVIPGENALPVRTRLNPKSLVSTVKGKVIHKTSALLRDVLAPEGVPITS